MMYQNYVETNSEECIEQVANDADWYEVEQADAPFLVVGTLSATFRASIRNFNYAAIAKDSQIRYPELAAASGYQPGDDMYKVWCLELITQIYKRTKMICRLVGYDIDVLGDVAASEYTFTIVKTAIRQCRNRVRRLEAIDMKDMHNAQKKLHLMRLAEAKGYYQGLRQGQTWARAHAKRYKDLFDKKASTT